MQSGCQGADVSSRLPIALSTAIAIALAVAAGPAAALGLGQLQVKSRPGQPLVAEIPIVSSDPTELEGLQVQLASPDTFSRVGLEPPQGVVSSLRFEPTLDASGRPVIRVTSAVPVETPLLTFLLQVDWSQGRLVREYSALLDTPDTVAATAQPPIVAPTVAPSNAIVRPLPIPPIAIETPPPVAKPIPPVAPVVVPPAPVALAPAPVSAPEPTSVTEAAPQPTAPKQFGPVRPGQTLGEIAASVNPGGHQSAAQTMLALLRANPDAFIGGNVNRLKQGAVLTIPAAGAIAAVDRSEAAALLHQQIGQWRAAQPAKPQPQAVATSTAPAATREAPKPQPAAKPTRTVGARLEIAPPSAGSRQRAGTQSGIEAGGEGEMLRQQLQETKETLAARNAEVNELKTRVAELEKLQQQQQQLLTLKDSALAAAQQTLAKSNAAVATPTPAPATPKPSTQAVTPAPVASTQAATPAPPQAQGSGFWLWGGLMLLVAATIGWLLTRKRPAATAVPKRSFDTEALAASIPVARSEPDAADEGVGLNTEFMPDQLIAPRPMQAPRTARVAVTEAVAPPWHGDVHAEAPAAVTTLASPNAQLAIAQACLDRGDDDAARVLLLEVMDGRDPAARDVAARLLRDL